MLVLQTGIPIEHAMRMLRCRVACPLPLLLLLLLLRLQGKEVAGGLHFQALRCRRNHVSLLLLLGVEGGLLFLQLAPLLLELAMLFGKTLAL